MNDPAVGLKGGKGENITIGLNWYVNANVRLMTNYVLVNNDPYATDNGEVEGDDDFSLLQFRLQVTF